MTPRPSAQPRESTVGDTVEDERRGFVLLDGKDGVPHSYKDMDVLRSSVATQEFRMQVEVPKRDGTRTWRKVPGAVDTTNEPMLLNQQLRHDMATGADYLAAESYVPANDPHYDAKVFPSVHPHGTGSV